MVVQIYWKTGAIETYVAQPQSFKEVAATCFYIDKEGVHLGVGTLDECISKKDRHDGLPETNNVIVEYDVLHEVETVLVDGVKVEW